MKTRFVVVKVVAILSVTFPAGALDNGRAKAAVKVTANFQSDGSAVIATPAPPSARLANTLNAYQQRLLDMVLERTSVGLEQITRAAKGGAISADEAALLSAERYQTGLAMIELLQALYDTTASELKNSNVEVAPKPAAPLNIVQVAPPSSSNDVSPELVEYLELNPAQIAAIQALVQEDRKTAQPLTEEVQKQQRAIAAAAAKGSSGEKQVRHLAAEQAKVVEKIILANAEFEAKLYQVLNEDQRQKLDSLRNATVSSVQPETIASH